MGPLTLAGARMIQLAEFIIPGRPWPQSTLCAGLLLVLGILSWQQAWTYESEETLWTDTLAKNENCWAGHNNLGQALLQKGQVDEAMGQYQKALDINPNFDLAHNNLGQALLQKRQVDEAMAQFRKALEITPNYAAAQSNLGAAFLQKGQVDRRGDCAIPKGLGYQSELCPNPLQSWQGALSKGAAERGDCPV